MAKNYEQVLKVVEQVVPLPEGADMSTKLDTLGMDSLDLVELVQNCEDEFGVSISDEDAEKLAQGTIADLSAHIEGLQNNLRQAPVPESDQ